MNFLIGGGERFLIIIRCGGLVLRTWQCYYQLGAVFLRGPEILKSIYGPLKDGFTATNFDNFREGGAFSSLTEAVV